MLTAQTKVPYDHDRYADFLDEVRRHFAKADRHMFTTDAAGLWEAYLEGAPFLHRQERNCNACRKFIETYGGLVAIDEEGNTSSAIWPPYGRVPPHYRDSVRGVLKAVGKAKVTGVFLSSAKEWGTPVTGPWTHLAVTSRNVWSHPLKTASQEMAAKLEEYGMLGRSLADFDTETVRKAVAILSNESLYRSEKVLGVAKWLLELHEALDANKRNRRNLMWLAVAKAPPGYCHVRSSMIGTLLEDLAADLPFETVKRKFSEKMNPLQYMRPQAAPSAGNIAQAEKIVETLQAVGSLERRFARLEDLQPLWTPNAKKPAKGGVFGHLVKKPQPTINNAPPTSMTWVKFAAAVLPTAEQIDFLVPHGRESYTALVTAKNPDAPNLLQWDNTISHYVYLGGSPASQWNLQAGAWRKVNAVVLSPWMWTDPEKFKHHGKRVNFILDDCRDMTYRSSGGMFPEQMKSEYHQIRRTLEAYFQNATIEGRDEATACGIVLGSGATWNATFRVTAGNMQTSYRLDRWD